MADEGARFVRDHPRSRRLARDAGEVLVGGVPMRWMNRWPGSFPVFFESATGARLADVDGNEYVDLCLGDTGAMAGHSPPAVVEALHRRMPAGFTAMLPSEDAIAAGVELQRRFGLRRWQFALTATDANRITLRLARALTGRPKVLVFNGCYHGTVDETYATLKGGAVVARNRNVGPPVEVSETTRVVEFNDPDALAAALSDREVACVIAEPAMTNFGMILPERGFHQRLRELTRETETLLILDETHTFCAGPGGSTAADGLEPDALTIGKAIGGGVPVAAFGVTEELGSRLDEAGLLTYRGPDGIGGTLAGNALSMAATRATLEAVLTDEAFDHMIGLSERLVGGVQEAVDDFALPWHVVRLGARSEYRFCADPPPNASVAVEGADGELDRYMHLFAMNRGVLLAPFHSMALTSPATTAQDVDRHTAVFRSAIEALAGVGDQSAENFQ